MISPAQSVSNVFTLRKAGETMTFFFLCETIMEGELEKKERVEVFSESFVLVSFQAFHALFLLFPPPVVDHVTNLCVTNVTGPSSLYVVLVGEVRRGVVAWCFELVTPTPHHGCSTTVAIIVATTFSLLFSFPFG